MAAGRTVLCLVVLFVCTLLLHSRDVDALQCYQCGALGKVSSDSCGDPFKKSGVPTCTAGAGQVCLKTKADDVVLTRACSPMLPGMKIGCQDGQGGGHSGHICLCDTELCNSTPPTALATFTFISVCALSTLVYVSLFWAKHTALTQCRITTHWWDCARIMHTGNLPVTRRTINHSCLLPVTSFVFDLTSQQNF